MPSPKELAKALAYQGEIRNTSRNRLLGGVADFLAPVSEFADRDKLPGSIPLLGGMSFADLSGLKGTESLVRDMSHGKSPVRGATLNTAKVDPRLLDLAAVSGAMIPVGKALGKAALREGARQIETGTGVLGSKVMNPRMNMFAGEGAKTADKQALKVAKDMKAAGVPDEAIHAKTGWFAGMADGKWRFEIDDSAAKGQFTHLSPSLDRLAEKAIIHPSIYKAYPDLSEINQLGLKEARESGSNISYSTNGKPSSKGTIIAEAPDEAGIKSVGLHELQHAIQRREGFARGGTPEEFITSTVNGTTLTPEAQEMFNSALIKNHPKMSSEEIAFRQRDAAQKVYESLAGESEARLTAMRMDMTAPERAASYPPSMFDLYVPVKDQIVRYGDNVGGAMMQRPKTEFEILHDTAQRNAALPVEQGGLGLPSGNTAMDRAGAMGFDTPAYHGTNVDLKEFIPSKNGRFGEGIYTTNNPLDANGHAYKSFSMEEPSNVMPLLTQKPDLEYAGGAINVINKPADIRSRFAAFDPMRRHEADILAGVGVGGMLDPQAIAEALRQQDRK